MLYCLYVLRAPGLETSARPHNMKYVQLIIA